MRRRVQAMQLLPTEIIQVNQAKLADIDNTVRSIYRLIIYSRHHTDDDLLDSYLKGTHSLRELLSMKNAQMEAQTELEARDYLVHFKAALEFVIGEIIAEQTFEREMQLFQLLRIAAPEANAIHPNRYRDTLVQVGGHLCPEPGEVSSLVNGLLYQMQLISNPIVRAIYFHHELIRIHPFVDGNGRVTRLAKNWMLMFELYPPTFITDVADKKVYTNALAESFRELSNAPDLWSSATANFFDNELDYLLFNAKSLDANIRRIGAKREDRR